MFHWLQRVMSDPQDGPPMTARAPEPSAGTETTVGPVANLVMRAESRNEHFPFQVHLMVRYWAEDGVAVPDPFVIAQAGIERRVLAVTRLHSITEPNRVRRELEVALTPGKQVECTGIVAWGQCLDVQSPKRYVEVLRRHEELRRQETIRVWERETEEAEITYLSRMIDDPARATAWWFRQHPDSVRDLPEIARTFQALRADLAGRAFAGDGVPDTDGSADSWDEVVAEFHRRAEPSDRFLLAHQLQRIFTELKLEDLADRTRRLDGNPLGD